jgi:DNA-binding transcriptional LysR family regulator
VDIRKLGHFLALVQHGTFHRAADAVHMSQSALSRSIQALEEEIGYPLLDRRERKSQLTVYGARLLERAPQLMAELNEIGRELSLIERGEAGHVSVGMSPTPAAILSKPLMLHMASRLRGPTLTLATGETTDLLKALRAETYDLVVVDANAMIDTRGLEVNLLDALQADFHCRAEHPLRQLARPSFEDARAYPVACSPISHAAAVELVRAFGPDGHPDRLVTITSHDYGTMREIALQTDLVLMGMTTTFRADIEAGRLYPLGLVTTRDVGRYAIARLACRRVSPALATIHDIAVRHFQAW